MHTIHMNLSVNDSLSYSDVYRSNWCRSVLSSDTAMDPGQPTQWSYPTVGLPHVYPY